MSEPATIEFNVFSEDQQAVEKMIAEHGLAVVSVTDGSGTIKWIKVRGRPMELFNLGICLGKFIK